MASSAVFLEHLPFFVALSGRWLVGRGPKLSMTCVESNILMYTMHNRISIDVSISSHRRAFVFLVFTFRTWKTRAIIGEKTAIDNTKFRPFFFILSGSFISNFSNLCSKIFGGAHRCIRCSVSVWLREPMCTSVVTTLALVCKIAT